MQKKPFLKWAGGKFRILDRILKELPQGRRFVEPFAGSGAVYLNVRHTEALVADMNADLIQLYRHVQEEGESFIQFCRSFFVPENNTRERYLHLRNMFNSSREPVLRSALLLYLNRHAFNGLVRYNSKGAFNVPFGKYKRPYFPLNELRCFYRKTHEVETAFVCQDFRATFTQIREGDVVYCDPPYVPLSETANFTSYAGTEFTAQDQQDLARFAREAHRKGICVLLSNHDTGDTRDLYADARIRQFSVRRFISRDGANRAITPEILAIYRRDGMDNVTYLT